MRRTGAVIAGLVAACAWAAPAHAATERLVWSAAAGPPQPSGTSFSQTTYRVIARVTAPGTSLRIRLSNVAGGQALQFGDLSIARRTAGAAVDPATRRALTFGGSASFSLPAGTIRFSDPVALDVKRGDDLAISLYVPNASTITQHDNDFEGDRKGATQFLTLGGRGDTVTDDAGTSFTQTQASVPWVDAITAQTDTPISIVCFGDSITDGSNSVLKLGASRLDAYDRYPDVLEQRLTAAGIDAAVSNQGISGDTSANGAGRFGRDVLDLPGVTHAIIEIGSNDLASSRSAEDIIGELRALATRLKDKGIVGYVATILPRALDQGDKRTAVNAWIRDQHDFDGVVDFDAAVRDPNDPNRIAAPYDASDATHLTPAGYAKLADAIDLTRFTAPSPSAAALRIGVRPPASIRRATLQRKGVPLRLTLSHAATVSASITRRGAKAALKRVKAPLAAGKHTLKIAGIGLRARRGSYDVVIDATTSDGAHVRLRRHLTIRK